MKKPDIAMSKLSPQERTQFFDAKRSALDKQTQKRAWSPAPRSEAPAGNLVPMRFLLKWKKRPDGNTEANARVLFQGFKLAEVTGAPLDTQSPTLWRVGRNCLLTVAAHRSWRLFNGDVSAAFHQADDLDAKGVLRYGEPDKFMRKHLCFKGGEVLKMSSPPLATLDPRSSGTRRLATC